MKNKPQPVSTVPTVPTRVQPQGPNTFTDLKTDYDFKSVFGAKENQALTIQFLNAALKGERTIKSIQFLDKEILGVTRRHRTVIADILSNADDDSDFIIELQRTRQPHFPDRAVLYASSVIFNSGTKGNPDGKNWNYKLRRVYFIGIVDFKLEDPDPNNFYHHLRLTEMTKATKMFYPKLDFIFMELSKVAKGLFTEEELRKFDPLQKWLYMIKNLEKRTKVPRFYA